ncbi:hypothetical protein AHF37_03108 [Paragonimus kellicotti]|nr:hypothetical protein AHF37_03108 [Paragonimus kellicotti]
MSLNQAHHPGTDGVVLFYGERLLIFYDGCDVKLGAPIKGSFSGRVYLTSHRVVFVASRKSSGVQSLSMPFVNMKEVNIQQPVFGANRIVGRIRADPNGGWQGEAEFSITFKKGGAIEFGQALIELGKRACDTRRAFQPPPAYTPMDGAAQYYNCPPPAYAPPQGDPYYGFVPQHEAFSAPPAASLFYVGTPPPYPGAVSQNDGGWAPTTFISQQTPPYPTPPYPSSGATSTGVNYNSSHQPVSSAHAAKAAEAAASATNNVGGGYYFTEDPHTVYAQPSAPPPPYAEAPHYPTQVLVK